MEIDCIKYPGLKALYVTKSEQLVLHYARQDMKDISGKVFSVGCIFKSFVTVLLGIAIREKRINSIEDCVLDYVDYDGIPDTNWYKCRLKHAMSKTTGLKWPDPMDDMPANMKEVLQLRFTDEPGECFSYKPDPQIIVYILEDLYHCTIEELFSKKLLPYFKDKHYIWEAHNIEGLQVSIPMLLELGQLMLHKGKIGDVTLFTEEYYEQCIHAFSDGGFPECTAYGLGWWIDAIEGEKCYFGAGFGGQKVIFIPERKMSIVSVSEMDRPHPEYRDIIVALLQEVKQ